MVENWVELTVNDGLFRAKVEIVRLYVNAWGLSLPRLGVVTGVGPSGALILPDSVLRFFLLGVSPSTGGGAKGRGQDESSCDPVV